GLRGGCLARSRDGLRLPDPRRERPGARGAGLPRRACATRRLECPVRRCPRLRPRFARSRVRGGHRRAAPHVLRRLEERLAGIVRAGRARPARGRTLRGAGEALHARGREAPRRSLPGRPRGTLRRPSLLLPARLRRRGRGPLHGAPELGGDRRLGRAPPRSTLLGAGGRSPGRRARRRASHVTHFAPLGTAREAWLRATPSDRDAAAPAIASGADPEDFEPAYLGWEIARCAPGLLDADRRTLAGLAAACVLSMRAGSTRLPLEGAPLTTALAAAGFPDVRAAALELPVRARLGAPGDPVVPPLGRPGAPTPLAPARPLIADGDWFYAERMRALEERFGPGVRARAPPPATTVDARRLGRAVN